MRAAILYTHNHGSATGNVTYRTCSNNIGAAIPTREGASN